MPTAAPPSLRPVAIEHCPGDVCPTCGREADAVATLAGKRGCAACLKVSPPRPVLTAFEPPRWLQTHPALRGRA